MASTRSLSHQTLQNWLRVHKAGKLIIADDKVVTPEQIELSRLRAENAQLKMERNILKKPIQIFLIINALKIIVKSSSPKLTPQNHQIYCQMKFEWLDLTKCLKML